MSLYDKRVTIKTEQRFSKAYLRFLRRILKRNTDLWKSFWPHQKFAVEARKIYYQ